MSEIIPDIPRAYTSYAEWGACLLYILILRHRLHGWKIWFAALAGLGLQTTFLVLTDRLPLVFWVPCMAIAFAIMFLIIYICCDISPKDVGYFTIRAFILAEFAASLEWQVYWFFWPGDTAPFLFKVIMLIGIYLIVGIIVLMIEKRHLPSGSRMAIKDHELWTTAVIGVMIFFISNMSFVSVNTPFSSFYAREVMNIRTLVDLGGVAILYAYHIQCCQVRAWRELEAMQNVLKNQYMQYQQSRETIDLINRKYHDLKYQITALRAEQDPGKRNAWLDAMESDIKDYEAQNKTGNTVLDTVLTGKSLYCRKHNIGFTCVADGALLQFMDVMDICTIFGNALDNAIEYERQVPEEDKRLIHVSVSQQKGFLLLRFENYCDGQLQFEHGLPVTTKKDVDYHGYGLKNIRYTAQKYGGEVTASVENNWFELKVLIPI